jgi:DNA-binding helix-hairpin-helix protein with protein kinase domain
MSEPDAASGQPSKIVGLGTRRPSQLPLDQGGQGYIFALEDDPGLVMKVFMRPSANLSARMEALADQGRRISGTAPRQPVAWPTELYRNEDDEIGAYVMRRYSKPVHHQLETLFAPVTRQEVFPRADWKFLVGIARNIAAVVAGLHADQAGFVVGDLTPANIVTDAEGYVTLLDSDSMQFTDPGTREVFASTAMTANYAPPELQSVAAYPRSAATDDFALAVIVLQLLLCGEHPFLGQPADGTEGLIADNIREARSHLVDGGLVRLPRFALNADVLPPHIRSMAVSAFRAAHLDARQRPAAREWVAALDQLMDEAKTCAAGHAYSPARGECPWCERLFLRLPDPFGKSLPADYEPSARLRAAAAAIPPTMTVPQRQPDLLPVVVPPPWPPQQPVAPRTRARGLVISLVVLVLIVLVIILVAL